MFDIKACILQSRPGLQFTSQILQIRKTHGVRYIRHVIEVRKRIRIRHGLRIHKRVRNNRDAQLRVVVVDRDQGGEGVIADIVGEVHQGVDLGGDGGGVVVCHDAAPD